MSQPKVSIMIPAYNQAGFVERAIRSALEQDYPNLEVVVSDDCSSDRTADIAEAFIASSGDPRARVVRHAENLGILRNYHDTLYHQASGDWALNLDADDYLVDRSFVTKAMAAAAADPAIVLVFADYCEIIEGSGQRIDIRNHALPAVMDGQNFLDRFANGCLTWNHDTIVYNRSAAMAIGCYWDPVVPRNDWDSFLRLVVERKVAFVDTVAAAWAQHGSNETHRLDTRKFLANLTIIENIASFARTRGLKEQWVIAWRRRMTRLFIVAAATAYLRKRDYQGLLTFLRQTPAADRGTMVRAMLAPAMLGRALLSVSPSLYHRAKRLARR